MTATTTGTPVETVVTAAQSLGQKVTKSGAGWTSNCPGPRHSNGDRRPSLKIDEGNDGRALLYCHAGCDTAHIVEALGLTDADLFPRDSRTDVVQLRPRQQPRTVRQAPTAGPSRTLSLEPSPAPAVVPSTSCDLGKCASIRKGADLGQCVAQYTYTDAGGHVVGQVHRYDPKTFRPFTRDAGGQWKAGGKIPTPYRLPEVLAVLAAGGLTVIVEGEKDADALAALGLDGVAATCNAGGAGKWTEVHSQALAGGIGSGSVCIVGDVDAAGQDHVRKVRESLAAVGIDAAVQWPTRGKDLAEHLANGGTLADLADDPEGAEPVEVAPFPSLGPVLSIDDLAQLPPIRSLVKGYLSSPAGAVLIGSYGLGKTAITLAMAACVASGTPFLGNEVKQARTLYVIGEGARGMPRRVHAWEKSWDRKIPRESLSFMVRPRGKLHKPETWRELSQYCQSEGYGFVILDTLSALAAGSDETKDAAVVMDGLNGLAETINGTALLVHHTGWGDKTRGRGGSQYEADADEVLIVSAFDQSSPHLAVTVKKAKDGESGHVHHMRRIVVPLGYDVDGEPLSSVTVEYARAADGNMPLRERVLVHLAAVEVEGASKSQLAGACEVDTNNGALARAISGLVSDGSIIRQGTGNRVRYYDPGSA